VKNHSMRVADDSGQPPWTCRNCGQPMQRWKHAANWVPPRDKGYFTFWFECMTESCRTKQVMPKEGFVKPGAALRSGPSSEEQMLCAEDLQRLAHFRET
jgi:hypothetical protein